MGVKFENNTIKVVNSLKANSIKFLTEAGAMVRKEAVRNTSVDSGQLKNSWKYKVDKNQMKVNIGSPLENAIWEEFGTGEYALEGNGRNSPWFIPVDTYKGHKKPTYQGEVIIVYGKNGKAFYKTDGKKPKRTLQRAMETKEKAITDRFKQLMREVGE